MSQAKVERYKKEKAMRKQTMAREKVKRICGRIIGSIVLVALVAWAGVSAYQWYENSRPEQKIYCDISDITDYLYSLNNE